MMPPRAHRLYLDSVRRLALVAERERAMRKFILTREGLCEAIGEAVVALLGAAVVIGLALYFRSYIAGYMGETLTKWLLLVVLILFFGTAISLAGDVVEGWLRIRKQEAEDKREQAELERKEQREKAEWDAFANWVKQNPMAAESLMCIAESEQIKDPEYRAWIADRRQTQGPNVLTDLPRLFDWLKARRDIKQFGLDTDLPPQTKE